MLNFGDLFFVDEKEYVWLFSNGEKIYAAIILNAELTNRVKALGTKADRRGISHTNLTYCYVELNTENYTDCSAHMAQTQKDMLLETTPIRSIGKKLDRDDLIEIRAEILDTPELFNDALVEHVREIKLTAEEA
jgi:hypothetical protein